MSTQALPEAAKTKANHTWLQRLAANLGFSSATGLRETLERAVAEADREGEDPLPPQERAMIVNVLGFGALRVSEVMAPRVDIVAVSSDQPLSDLLQLFASSGHSRLPVFEDNLDDVIGMVHIKDVVAWIAKQNLAGLKVHGIKDRIQPSGALKLSSSIAEAGLTREILFVPSSMSAIDLLAKMRSQRIQLAIVIDEFGGTDGLVSMEDLVEGIVGDISDEHDKVQQQCDIGPEAEGFVVSARTPIEAVEQALGGVELAYDGATGDVDTLGGLIMAIEGSMPGEGQIVMHPSGVAFEILEASQRRIEKVRIHRALALPAPAKSEPQLALPAPASGSAESAAPARGERGPSARAA